MPRGRRVQQFDTFERADYFDVRLSVDQDSPASTWADGVFFCAVRGHFIAAGGVFERRRRRRIRHEYSTGDGGRFISKASKGHSINYRRRLPIGAEVQPEGGVHFRVWAPRRKQVELILETESSAATPSPAIELTREPSGHFSAFVAEARTGSLYRFRLDGLPQLYPDPASRYQPDGAHGASQVVDPAAYAWRINDWPGLRLEGQVLYELHIGTFTPEGTFTSAIRELARLKELGITAIELMPVAEFPGRFGWGYDGVDLFAPTHVYGHPNDLRALIDAAHEVGLGVIHDVVYNHFGPSGNYTCSFAEDFFHAERGNEWGNSINFDGEHSQGVREFFRSNAGYWIDEYRFDGLRLDATQAIHDESSPHILAEISEQVRQSAAGRATLIFSENERQEAIQIRSIERGGFGLDAAWNDDFHHSAVVALTGQNEYYYMDYRGTPQELISAAKWGYLFQGQWCKLQQKRRGTPCGDILPAQFVTFLENHDQLANTARGLRIHDRTSPGRYRAMTGLWLLMPGTPMFFQGQEYGASTPFFYFADHEPELAELVRKGRFDFLKNFPRVASEKMAHALSDPENMATFERSKLDAAECARNVKTRTLHRDLLQLRRADPVFRLQRADRLNGAVLAEEALVLRFGGDAGDDRLLLVNLGRDVAFDPAPEPLLAPPERHTWKVIWSSEWPVYGGEGTPPLDTEANWRLPGHAAVVLAPDPIVVEPVPVVTPPEA